jgi:hypothetical protein
VNKCVKVVTGKRTCVTRSDSKRITFVEEFGVSRESMEWACDEHGALDNLTDSEAYGYAEYDSSSPAKGAARSFHRCVSEPWIEGSNRGEDTVRTSVGSADAGRQSPGAKKIGGILARSRSEPENMPSKNNDKSKSSGSLERLRSSKASRSSTDTAKRVSFYGTSPFIDSSKYVLSSRTHDLAMNGSLDHSQAWPAHVSVFQQHDGGFAAHTVVDGLPMAGAAV